MTDHVEARRAFFQHFVAAANTLLDLLVDVDEPDENQLAVLGHLVRAFRALDLAAPDADGAPSDNIDVMADDARLSPSSLGDLALQAIRHSRRDGEPAGPAVPW